MPDDHQAAEALQAAAAEATPQAVKFTIGNVDGERIPVTAALRRSDGMTPAVSKALDALDARVAAIADSAAALHERITMDAIAKAQADAQAAEEELWARSSAVAKAAGVPLDAAMVRVIETDPALARRLDAAPEPVAKTAEAEPVPVGAAGRQLDALADEIAKADDIPRVRAFVKAMDARPDLAEAASAEQWESLR